ncbi:hypothetical protein B0H13DRAFT_1858975 [Mycena leptocephala]|nr:hypothetical protein B0H13DRAFT_1858975 [Mycena leptocephala]
MGDARTVLYMIIEPHFLLVCFGAGGRGASKKGGHQGGAQAALYVVVQPTLLLVYLEAVGIRAPKNGCGFAYGPWRASTAHHVVPEATRLFVHLGTEFVDTVLRSSLSGPARSRRRSGAPGSNPTVSNPPCPLGTEAGFRTMDHQSLGRGMEPPERYRQCQEMNTFTPFRWRLLTRSGHCYGERASEAYVITEAVLMKGLVDAERRAEAEEDARLDDGAVEIPSEDEYIG